eukprot:TRINITY_DN13005_c0_g3_i2.p1 TRINITY_DN13005_c0_g3~~TRINITY_DN13005_c0_g3_i2.p1  ORF type:complete len:652 (-),score=128.27 TRINITY_DN13005_c0_g3_i2:30-1985(-)
MSVSVFQNERHNGICWSSPFPTDRGKWSDRTGEVEYPGGISGVVLVPTLEWASDWKTGAWEYAFNFGTTYRPKDSFKAFVRRRVWTREYRAKSQTSAPAAPRCRRGAPCTDAPPARAPSPTAPGGKWKCGFCGQASTGDHKCAFCGAFKPKEEQRAPPPPAVPTYGLRMSCVDGVESHDSVREQRERMREELKIMAPTIRALFKDELPNTSMTYLIPSDNPDPDIDESATRYLGSFINKMLSTQGTRVRPLNTTGDGSCCLHAVSRGIWGVEIFSTVLRIKVFEELQAEADWYREKLGQSEWQIACQQVSTPSGYLSNVHVAVLANVLCRPIIVFASQEDIDSWGTGYNGVAGIYAPLRRLEWCAANPICISWQSKSHNHYVPISWVKGDPTPCWPMPKLSGKVDIDMDVFQANAPDAGGDMDCPVKADVEEPRFISNLVHRIKEIHCELQTLLLQNPPDLGQRMKVLLSPDSIADYVNRLSLEESISELQRLSDCGRGYTVIEGLGEEPVVKPPSRFKMATQSVMLRSALVRSSDSKEQDFARLATALLLVTQEELAIQSGSHPGVHLKKEEQLVWTVSVSAETQVCEFRVTFPAEYPEKAPRVHEVMLGGLPAKFSTPLPEWQQLEGTCLLYTSPSPRDRTRSRMPSSA